MDRRSLLKTLVGTAVVPPAANAGSFDSIIFDPASGQVHEITPDPVAAAASPDGSNPASVLLEMIRVMGWRDDEIDLPSFELAAAYCDRNALRVSNMSHRPVHPYSVASVCRQTGLTLWAQANGKISITDRYLDAAGAPRYSGRPTPRRLPRIEDIA
jgi:hypothetical protein